MTLSKWFSVVIGLALCCSAFASEPPILFVLPGSTNTPGIAVAISKLKYVQYLRVAISVSEETEHLEGAEAHLLSPSLEIPLAVKNSPDGMRIVFGLSEALLTQSSVVLQHGDSLKRELVYRIPLKAFLVPKGEKREHHNQTNGE